MSCLSSQGPSLSAVTQQFTYMLMKTGTIVLKAETDLKGYTPEQIIQVTANIHNQSGKTSGNIMASLVQVSSLICKMYVQCTAYKATGLFCVFNKIEKI